MADTPMFGQISGKKGRTTFGSAFRVLITIDGF
jgi:hypothetical protein